MSLNSAIEKIVIRMSTQFGAEDPSENEMFKGEIRKICAEELEPVFTAQAAGAVPIQYGAPVQKRGRNGYNEFSAELRTKLVVELGSEELAKAEFVKRGGVTGEWVKNKWHSLSDAEKAVYNAKAKEGRSPVAVPIAGVAKRAPSPWQRYQKAYGAELKSKKASGEEIPVFANIGARTKACSAEYQKVKGKPELDVYLSKWGF